MIRLFPASLRGRFSVDLADDDFTGGFSGVDIAGLVRNAGSIALAKARADGRGVEGLLVSLEDVKCALKEMKMRSFRSNIGAVENYCCYC